jgi:predicted amidohydrolase YtcJ
LERRSVIPGLIDNHLHLLRYGTTWQYEVRLDGVETREEALARLRARAARTARGEWIYTLGGWAIEQFSDDDRPFTRAELDEAAPEHPVFLQASYYEAYVNSAAIDALGLARLSDVPGIERDAAGRPTGRLDEGAFRRFVPRLPAAGAGEIEASTLGMIRELNAAGLTAVGSVGCETELLERYRRWADAGRLNLRVFCITSAGGGAPDQLLPRIASMRLFQGDHRIDHVAYGEGVYGPLHDPMFRRLDPRPEDLATWRHLVTGIAQAGLPLHVHANFAPTIEGFLDQIEQVHREVPVTPLRWTLAHLNEPTAAQLERMRALGVSAAVHPWAVINGGINERHFRDAALGMPPLSTIEASGIRWGLGSDGSRANQVLPLQTLGWAVTGRMAGGRRVLHERHTIGREAALIAHTRSNAWLLFQEARLGSIRPGMLADLVVLDRDYLTVPAGDIAHIEPVLTMVGGRIVYER